MSAQYTNAVRGVTVDVTETRGQRISYAGRGTTAVAYRGYLDYAISGSALEIHTVDAKPEGCGLGAILLLEAALIAPRYGKSRIQAVNVALTAQRFYLNLRFHPSQEIANNLPQTPNLPQIPNIPFVDRVKLGRVIPTWDADRNDVQIAAAQYVRRNGWA